MRKIFLIITFLTCFVQLVNAQPVEVIGVTAPETIGSVTVRSMQSGISDIKLKKLDNSVSVSGVEIGTSGFYTFDFSGVSNYSGFYKLYINNVEKQEFGIRQVAKFLDNKGTVNMEGNLNFNGYYASNLHNPSSPQDAVTLSFLQAGYLPLAGGEMEGVLDMGQNALTNLTTPVSAGDAVNLSYLQSNYPLNSNVVKYAGTQTITGTITFTASSTFFNRAFISSYSGLNILSNTSVPLNAYVWKQGMMDYVNYRLNTLPATAPYQQAAGTIRLVAGGTITDQVQSSWVGGIGAVASYISTGGTNKGILLITGNNTANAHWYAQPVLDESSSILYSEFPEGVNIAGWQSDIMIDLPDIAVTVTAGSTTLENLTFVLPDDDGLSHYFNGYTFKNCRFIKAGSNQSPLQLQNCKLIGVNTFNCDVTLNTCTSEGLVVTSGTPTLTSSPNLSVYYNNTLYAGSSRVGQSGFYINGATVIDANGFTKPVSSSDLLAPSNSVYYSTTASKLVYKDAGGTVHNLY